MDVTRLGDGGYVQAFLAQQSPLLQIFNGDITVCGRDAAVLAVLPVARGRRGADHADRESVQKVVSTGRAVVSEPVFSSFLNYPIIAICAPVTGPGNQVEGKGQAGWASTGLGLPFCKLAVEAHQGTLGVESAPGEGSCFLVRLPIGN